MTLINQNSIIGVTSITSTASSDVITFHTSDTTERLRIDTSGNATFGGNVSVAGVLTYEDVTSVDAVGLSTFQNGIHVTGGSVGIGTDNPQSALDVFDISRIKQVVSGNTNQIEFFKDATPTFAASVGLSVPAVGSINDALVFTTYSGSWNERLRITSSGNIGIGTDNPTAKLTVAVADGEAFRLQNLDSSIGGGESLHFALEYPNALGSSTGWRHLSRYAGSQYQIASNIDNAGYGVKLSITEQGKVSIGTEFSPGATLHIRDSNSTTQGSAQLKIEKGIGSGAAPSSVSRENCYIHLGGSEWGAGANGNYLMGFGYTNGETGTGIPAYIGFKEVTTSGYTYGDLIFGTRDNTTGTNNATERFRITSSGNVGIATDSPNTLLDIEKNMTQDDNIGFLRILNTAASTNSGSNTSLIVQNNNVRCQFFAWEASGIRMGVRNKLNTGSGNVYITAGNDTVRLTIDAATGNFTGSASADISDGRLKENIQNISATDAVNIIKGLQGRTFTWKAEANMGTDTKYGFIAQEVESILPNLVHQNNGINRVSKDADKQGYGQGEIIDDYSDSYKDDTQSEWSKSVEKTGIIPILVEALKDSIAKIETLESEVAALKAAQ